MHCAAISSQSPVVVKKCQPRFANTVSGLPAKHICRASLGRAGEGACPYVSFSGLTDRLVSRAHEAVRFTARGVAKALSQTGLK